jgi:hypothetical protein
MLRRHPVAWLVSRDKGTPLKKPNLQKPSKVERARARLDGAVTRLEAAIGAAPSAGVVAKELEGLRGENSELKALTATMSQRLDVAIGRLRTVIGE